MKPQGVLGGPGDAAPTPPPAGATTLQSELTSGERRKDGMGIIRSKLQDVGGCDSCCIKHLQRHLTEVMFKNNVHKVVFLR